MVKIKKYDAETEKMMKNFYKSLNEKEQRRYAALEIKKIGYGGQSYICQLFRCDHHKIERALEELNDKEEMSERRIREKGGGRKTILSQKEEIEEIFLEIMLNNTAGSPMREEIKWTNLKASEIVYKMEERGITISEHIAKQLFAKHGYKKRQAEKDEEAKVVENRNEQFEKIGQLREGYEKSGNPVISVDVKKKRK